MSAPAGFDYFIINFINLNIRKIQIGGASPPSRSTVQTQDLKNGNRRRYFKKALAIENFNIDPREPNAEKEYEFWKPKFGMFINFQSK